MQHAEIIKRIGPVRMKEWFGATSRRLADWRARGIPTRFWAKIVEVTANDEAMGAIKLSDLEDGYIGRRSVRGVCVHSSCLGDVAANDFVTVSSEEKAAG